MNSIAVTFTLTLRTSISECTIQNSVSRKVATVCDTERKDVTCSIYLLSTNTTRPKQKSRYTRTIFWFTSWPTVQPVLVERTPLLAEQTACSPAGVLHRRLQRDAIATTTSTLTLTITAAKTTPLPNIKAGSHRSQLKPLTVKRKQFKSPVRRA